MTAPTQTLPPTTPPGVPPAAAGVPPAGPGRPGRNKTLFLIIGGVVALAAIGLLLWLVLGGKDDPEDVVTLPSPSGTLSPSPVSTGPTAPATTAPPTAPPTTAPPTTPPPATGGVPLAGGAVVVTVPSDWNIVEQSDTAVHAISPSKDYGFARVAQGDAAADAGSVLSDFKETWFAEGYSNLAATEVETLQPFGSIVSLVRQQYRGTYAYQQGAVEVHGAIFVAVRQDGLNLVILVESTPFEALAANQPVWSPFVNGTMNGFGGTA